MFESLENRRMFDGSLPNLGETANETQITITEHMNHENQLNETAQFGTKPRQMAGQDGQTS